MRGVAVVLLIAICVSGAALADVVPQPNTPDIQWEDRPQARTFARHYPEGAANQGVSGAAVLCCSVNSRRFLDCEVAFEWPQGFGFGEASIAAARDFRMTEESYAQLHDAPAGSIRRTIRWMLPDRATSAEVNAAFSRISQAALQMCPAAVSEAPPAEPQVAN
jgi:hypothetical protein